MKKRVLRSVTTSCAVTLLLIGLNVFAQEETKRATKLDTVVVTASRVEEKKRETTSNITVIDEAAIKMSSARDLGDLLAEKGIGHIHKYPGAQTSIGIRGFRTEAHGNDLKGHVLILLNGRRAGTGNAAKISTKNIERIEIIRGPASVQYGSAGMGGIVNVITKQGKGKPSVSVEKTLGSFDRKEEFAGLSGKVDKFDFSGSFSHESMDDYWTGIGKKYHNTGFDDKEYFSLNLGYEFVQDNRIGLIYNKFNADGVGIPGYFSQKDFDDYKEENNESIDIIYDGGVPDGFLSWKFRYFEGEDKDKWFDPIKSNPTYWDDGIPSKRTTDQNGAQAQMSLNWESSRITAGFDCVNYEIETTWNPKKTKYENPAYFMLAKTGFFDDRFIVSGGLRYDKYKVEVKEPAGRKESDTNLSNQFGLAYLLTDYLKIRANYGEAFIMPAADQMASDYSGGWGTRYVGNPDLNPEKSETYEVGMDFSNGPFDAACTYFSTDFKDKIEAVAKSSSVRTWENIGDAKIQGWEGDLSYDIGSIFGWDFELRPYASFVYLTEYKDKQTDEELQYVSDAHLSYGIAVSELKGFFANLNFAYTGEQDVTDYESSWPYPVIEKDDFTVVNFTIGKKILETKKHGAITIKGEIKNLFDEYYAYVKGYPMPGRSFFVTLKYDF